MDASKTIDNGMVWVGDIMYNDAILSQPSETTFFGDDSKHLPDDTFRCPNRMDTDGFMGLDDFEASRWCSSELDNGEISTDSELVNSNVATATQTSIKDIPVTGSRKIKPVKHPALKLQTPIAYQSDTDLNVIPIQKDGRAVCKKCGAIGVKHAFYTRERQFCSLACARAATEGGEINEDMQQSQNSTELFHDEPRNLQSNSEGLISHSNDMTEVSLDQQTEIPQDSHFQMFTNQTELPTELPSVYTLPADEPELSADKKLSYAELSHSYDWAEQLKNPSFTAASVTCFKHVPMLEYWNSISTGIKVEVENSDCYDYCEEFPDSFWIATILRVTGYKALLRYEGFVDDNSKDFWINLGSSSVHPVGWCATRGKPLIPPKTIKDKYLDWKDFLVKRLTGARTLPSNYHNKVNESLKSRFRYDLTLEVVDKERISQVKVATIERICGKRLQLKYFDAKVLSIGSFWCHEDSPLIHPVGWSKRVGQMLCAPPEYHDRITKGLRGRDDATEDLFPIMSHLTVPSNYKFQIGMKLEAIDPLNLGDICIATIKQVLNEGYLMICVDFWSKKNSATQDWFCYHMTSSCIFPAGFCHINDIPLTPPKGYNRITFDWNDYLEETGCIAAPAELFAKPIPNHGFETNMKIEAADLMNPRLVCVATITRVVGRLLKIHFDGWEDDFDQWVDCESCDIYPVGWCEFVGHKLEHPCSHKFPSVGRSGRKRRYKGSSSHSSSKKSTNMDNSLPNTILDDDTSDSKSKNSRSPPQLLPITNMQLKQQQNNNDDDDDEDQDQNTTKKPVEAEKKTPRLNNSSEIKNRPNVEQVKQSDINNDKDSLLLQSTSNLPVKKEQPVSTEPKFIPNLEDIKKRSGTELIHPETWDHNDITEFLKINGCSAYCESFRKQKIDGKAFLELSKENVHILTDKKVGPSLKIQNLIHQLKYITTSHSRFMRNSTGKNVL